MSIIDLLKKNRYPFGTWPDPECYGPELGKKMQEKAREIGKKDFQCLMDHGVWLTIARDNLDEDFVKGRTYRLRSDYAEEPEKIEVRIIRGDGWISPVSTSSISAHVKEFDGKKWVSVVALNEAVKSIANAEYWLKKLNVWGNSNVVQKIYKLVGLTKDGAEEEADYADEPEIVECKIYKARDGNFDVLVYDFGDDEENWLSAIPHGYERVGFKFEDDPVIYDSPDIYSFKDDTFRDAHLEHLRSGDATVLHASHVLFRRQT